MVAEARVGELFVRQAGPGEFDLVLPLLEQFYREEGFEASLGTLAENLRHLLVRTDCPAFVALSQGNAVGVAVCSTSFGLEGGAYIELEDLFVEPASRGRGVATALVEAVAAWGEAQGFRKLEIVMTPYAQAKDDLAPWYRARGFKNTGRVIYELGL